MEREKIKKLPIYMNQKGEYLVKKDIVTNFPENFGIVRSDEYEYATTSGTTSDRMEIVRTPNWWQDEYKRTYANNEKLNKYLNDGLHKIIFTTAQCSNLICFIDKPPLEKRIIGNTLYVNNTFNPWTWTKEDIKQITEEINYFKPYYLDADPVYLTVYLFLKEKYKIKTKLYVPSIITLSYEFVTENTRKYIQKFFKTEIRNLYGTTEFGYVFLENDAGMKVCKDLVDVRLLEVSKENNLYTLIIDSFKNKYMPLLNYRVGDMVMATPEMVDNFNRDGIVQRMAGREKDLLNGNVSYAMIDDVITKISEEILLYQFYKINDQSYIFKYITENMRDLTEEEMSKISKALNEMGLEFKITYKLVEEIAPEMSGKFTILKRDV